MSEQNRTRRMLPDEFRETFAAAEMIRKPDGIEVHHGSSLLLDEMEIWARVPEGFEVAWGWCQEPYRMVWLDLDRRETITYCEGDVSLTVAPDDEAFAAERLEARRFYDRPRYMDQDYTGEGPLGHVDPEGNALSGREQKEGEA